MGIAQALNQAPSGGNFSINLTEDINNNYVLATSLFSDGFSDPDFATKGDIFNGIKITSLETAGDLEFYNGTSWVDVTLNQIINKTALNAGFLRYSPDQSGANATFGFAVVDSRGGVDTTPSIATINVTPSNDAPVVTGPVTLASVAEDSVITITKAQLLAHASDVDAGATLNITGLSASAGTLVDNLNGTWTLTPAANYNGTITLNYNVTDGTEVVATTATQVVTAVNDAPYWVEDGTSTPVTGNLTDTNTVSLGSTIGSSVAYIIEGMAEDVDTDIEDIGLTVTAFNAAGGAFQKSSDGGTTWVTLTTVPTTLAPTDIFKFTGANAASTASITWKLTDGSATSTYSETVTFHVVADAAPVAADDNLTASVNVLANVVTSFNDPSSFLANDHDAEDGAMTDDNIIAINGIQTGTTTSSLGATITMTESGFDYNPTNSAVIKELAAGETATDTFTYTIEDSAGNTDTATVSFTVTGVDDAPVFTIAQGDVTPASPINEDSSRIINVESLLTNNGASDADSDALGIAITSANTAEGTIWYSEDGGNTWSNITALLTGISETNAFLVPAVVAESSARLKFIPNANLNSTNDADVGAKTPTFTYKLTTNTEDEYGDTTQGTQYSTEIRYVKTQINAVNDAPFWVDENSDAIGNDFTQSEVNSVGANGSLSATVASIINNMAEDVDSEVATLGITITGFSVENGAYFEARIDGGEWTTLSTVPVTLAYTDEVRFVGGDVDAEATLLMKLNDGSLDSTYTLTQNFAVVTNHAPVVSEAVTLDAVLEDSGAITITNADLIANASDIDGDDLTATNVTASEGTLVDNENGTWTLTPAANYNGTITLTYDVTDGTESVATTATQVVTAVNDAPSFTSGTTLTTDEDTSATYTASATDVDGDTLTYTLQTAATNGSVTVNNGVFTYTPTANYNGVDSFVVRVNDGTTTVDRTVNVTVNAVNDAPVVSEAVTLDAVLEDSGAITITNADLIANASDIDGDDLTATNVTASEGTLVDNENGTWTLTPAANYNGTITLTYDVSDGTTTTAATATQVVTAVNDAPVLVADEVSLTAINEDSNGLPATTIADLIANGDITDADGAVDAIAITGIESSGPVQVTMNGANENSVDAATDVSGNIYIAYERGGVVYTNTYNATSQSWGSEVTVGNGTAPAIAVGADGNVHIAFVDGSGYPSYSLNGAAATEITTATTASRLDIGADGSGHAYVVIQGNADGDGYAEISSYDNTSDSFEGSVIANGWYDSGSGNYYSQPAIAVASDGTTHIAYQWTNWGGQASWSDVGISYFVDGVITSSTSINNSNNSYTLPANALTLDSNGNAHLVYALNGVYSVADLSAGWSAVPLPAAADAGSPSITVNGNDVVITYTSGGIVYAISSADTFTTPSAVETIGTTPTSPVVTASGDVIYLASDGDTEVYHTSVSQMPSPGTWYYSTDAGDSWTAINVAELSETNALLLSANDLVKFVPSANYNGDQSFTFKAWDQFTGTKGNYADTTVDPVGADEPAFSTGTGTATITVTPVNDAPTNIAITADTVAENAVEDTVIGTLSADDIEGDEITFTLTDNAGGAFKIVGNQLRVDDGSQLDYENNHSIEVTVRATDENGGVQDQIITINLTDVNDNAPTINVGQTFTIAENSAQGTSLGTVSTSDVDTAGVNPAKTFSIVSGNTGGYFQINTATGEISVTADGATGLNYEAQTSYTLTLDVTDSVNGPTQQTVVINVTDENEFAVGAISDTNATANSVGEHATVGTTVVGITAHATDADGTTNTVTYELTDNASGKFAINATTGVVTVAGALDYETAISHDITVKATSADGSFSSQTYTINVTDENDAPVVTQNQLYTALEYATTTINAANLASTDADLPANTLTYTLTSLATLGDLYKNATIMEVGDTFTAADIAAGIIKYANNGRGTTDLFGVDSFGFSVDDGNGGVTTDTFEINVYRNNQAPVLDLNGLVLADIHGNPVSYTENANAAAIAPVVSFTDSDTTNFNGGYLLVDVTANGEDGDVIAVKNGGSNGKITVSGDAISYDGIVIGHIDATQNGTNGEALKVILDGNAPGVVAIRHLVQSITFASNDVGTHADVVKTVSFTVNDGEGVVAATSTVANVTLTAHPVNDAPVVEDVAVSVNEDATTANLHAFTATDEENDSLDIISVNTTGTVGTVAFDADANTLTYAADVASQDALAVGESMTDTFTYTISDGNGGTDTATVTVTVNGVNDIPVAADDLASVDANSEDGVIGNVITSSDTDVDHNAVLTVTEVNADSDNVDVEITSTYGTFVIHADGSYTYQPDINNATLIALGEGDNLTDSITYTVSDEHGATDTATLTVMVNGVNDAPVITAVGEGFSESNVPFAFDGALGNPGPITVADAENDAILTVTLSVSSGTGTLSIDEDAAAALDSFTGNVSPTMVLVGDEATINAVLADLSFTSNTGWYGTGTLTITAEDDAGAIRTSTVSYEIAPTTDEYLFDASNGALVIEDGNGGSSIVTPAIYNFALGNGVGGHDYDTLLIDNASAADADIVIGDLDGNPGNGDNLLISFDEDSSVALVGVANDANFDAARISFTDGSVLRVNTSGEQALIVGLGGDDQLVAGNMGDTLRGLGGNDKLVGGNGNDWLYGGGGDDVLIAGDGNNILNGGTGNDTMTAGAGEDWFSYSGRAGGINSNDDTINGFDVSMDKIQLTGFATITEAIFNTVVISDTVGDGTGDALLLLNDGSQITLVGVNAETLSIDNFAGYRDTFDQLA